MFEPQATGTDQGSRALARYFQEVEKTELLSPEQEHAAAQRIVDARRAYWGVLLSYPGLRRSMMKYVYRLASDAVKGALGSANLNFDRIGARGSVANQDVERLADLLSAHDLSTDIADVIASDVESLDAPNGQGNALDKRAIRNQAAKFEDFRRRVVSARMTLNSARADFAQANLRLVLKMARNYRRVGGLPLSDLIQEGNIGLMIAVDRFDPSRGLRFSTYGIWWIRHQIHRSLTDKGRAVRLPSHVVELRARISEAKRKFEQKHCRAPHDEELAEMLNISTDKVERFARVLAIREQPRASGEDNGFPAGMDPVDETATAADVIDGGHLQDSLRDAIDDLPSMESHILRMRFGLDGAGKHSLRQIGEVYSLSRERIRQIQERALRRLRNALEAQGFDLEGLPADQVILS